MATGGQKLKGVINANESFLFDGESWKDFMEYRDVIIKAYGHGNYSESAARSGESD